MAALDIEDRISPWLRRWSITDRSQLDGWLANMALRTCDTDEFLVQAGAHSDTLYLLETGLVRLFYTTPDGRERNKAFYRSGDITGPVSAAITGSAAPFSIQCLEPCVMISFRFSDLRAATQESPQIANLYNNLLAEAFIRNEQREAVLLTCNAEQRYRWLLRHEPDLPNRVAQFHIASYLGIDAVSLSRIKRKLKA